MKIRHLLVTLISAFAIAAGVQAQEPKSKEDHTPLGEKMEKISPAWRSVKRQITDASKNEDTLTKLAAIKEHMTEALQFEPAYKKEKPVAEQAKFVSDFQARMKEEIAKVEKIAALVKAGNNEEAAKLVGALDQDYKDAHKQYKKPTKKKS